MNKYLAAAAALTLLVLLPSGCVAPMSNNLTGRSLGSGKVGLDGGVVFASGGDGVVPSVKTAVGVSQDLDLGAQYDLFSIGLFARNSFINNDEDLSLAGVLGLGIAASGFYGYTGPVISYKAGALEPYFGPRLNVVSYGESDSSSFISWEGGTFTYFQLTLGTVLWMSEGIGLNMETSVFMGDAGLVDFEDIVGMGGLTFRL